MIIDKVMCDIIDTFLTNSQISTYKVYDISLITTKRLRLPQFNAIYLILSTEENINLIIYYKYVHIFFTETLTHNNMIKIANSMLKKDFLSINYSNGITKKTNSSDKKIILFILEGITYSEILLINNLSKKYCDISPHIIDQTNFFN